MFVRRLPALTILGTLSFVLVNCSSDDPGTPNTGGTSTTAGTSSGGSASGSGGASGGTPSAGSSAGGMTAGSGGKAGSAATGGGGAATGGGGSGSGGATTGGGGSGGAAGGSGGASGGASGSGGGSTGGTFKLTSAEIMEGQTIPAAHTCTSKMGFMQWGVAPSFKWENPPAGTMSYAFFVIDWTLTMGSAMDTNGYHSAAWNIPTTVTSLNMGWMAADLGTGVKSLNGAYLGPCPPNGPDTYHMIVMAMPMASYTISGSGTAGVKSAYTTLKAAALGTAEVTGTYKQP